jgi:hypothetical protein
MAATTSVIVARTATPDDARTDELLERQTTTVIDPRFVFLGVAISLSGSYFYLRDTWRGVTAPNRVTWLLWGVEPLLAFAVEREQHIGLASVMTFVFGLVPLVIFAVSFHDRRSVWQIGRFDVACGVISVVGLGLWLASNEPTVGLLSFIAADAVAALPTLRKSFVEPTSESAWQFFASSIFAGITLLTLRHFTTAGALFPVSVIVQSTTIGILVTSELGPRWRARPAATPTGIA